MTTNVNYLMDVIMKAKLEVVDKAAAWKVAYDLTGDEIISYCKYVSDRAGYPIYMNITEEGTTSICDLGNRLEVNFKNGTSKNIWIREV